MTKSFPHKTRTRPASNGVRDFCTVPEAIEEVKKGRMLIVVDSPNRENEADLYIPADAATGENINTMLKYGGGIVCAAITPSQAHNLRLSAMVPLSQNTEKTGVNFTVSMNAKKGITTGVSAYDRAKTIRILANPKSRAEDIVKPGHVFGLVARTGGLLKREGHTEAAVDLARLAGRTPAGVLCEIVGENGRMARGAEIARFSRELKIKIVAIKDIVRYLRAHPLHLLQSPHGVARFSESTLPTRHGTFRIIVYTSTFDDLEHVALIHGDVEKKPVLVRVHSQCLTGDTFGSLRCDCREQLQASMEIIKKSGSGIIVYLNQEGRGIGLGNKIKAYALQDEGYDTVDANHALGFSADARDYEVAALILKDLGAKKIKLLTNNPEKERQLSSFGIKIAERVPLEISHNEVNAAYLSTKKKKLGHHLKKL
ncbi:MAG: GTP cyclohydrolase-2 [Candidatus Kaiserbacteria bacterium GW2011_GWA2_49_19]|uniref:GTP cyclohydrolase-2 n=2 Tax=Candidatus Kaiseribacteriota TaxID=1752734 RepID=A0A0G1VPI5_9BACT|nr:MAG: GTP cyclohydrolase-2 [Candidatus Kaiserbacteria bacterium GW2011_GWA2_49_19]